MFGLILILTLTLAGCATYHPLPLDKAAVDRALALPAWSRFPLRPRRFTTPCCGRCTSICGRALSG